MAVVQRTPCCVPFCRRWRRGSPTAEYVCWDHWKRIPLARRRAYFRAVAERAPEWLNERGKIPRWMQPRPKRIVDCRSIRSLYRLWGRLKRIAIESAL